MPSPVTHFEIIGGNGSQLQDFYASLMNWKIDANNDMHYGMVDTETPGKGIGGGIMGVGPGDQPRVTVYAEVPNLQESLDKAEKLGAKVLMGVTPVPGGPTIAMIADPAGNTMGLMQA